MDPTEGSETSANINQTLGIHPKVETVNVPKLWKLRRMRYDRKLLSLHLK
jgi:hypothetical protein